MRNVVLASAAMLSALLLATIAATMPLPRETGVTDPLLGGYGLYAEQAVQRR